MPCTEKEIKETLKEYDLDTDWVYKGLDMGQYRYVVDVNIDETVSYVSYGEPAQIVIEYAQVPPLYYLFR